MFITFHVTMSVPPGLPEESRSLSLHDHIRLLYPTLNLQKCKYLSLQIASSGIDFWLGSTPAVHYQLPNTGLKLPANDPVVFEAKGDKFVQLADMYLITSSSGDQQVRVILMLEN